MEARTQRLAYLERLAKELTSRGLSAELTSKGLKVANAGTPSLNERVQCERAEDGSWSFWWPWHQPIGPADDAPSVADTIAVVLRPVEAEQ